MIRLHCTYCWQIHWVESLDAWLTNHYQTCGTDRSRYFLTPEEYLDYVRRYRANGNVHPGQAVNLPLWKEGP